MVWFGQTWFPESVFAYKYILEALKSYSVFRTFQTFQIKHDFFMIFHEFSKCCFLPSERGIMLNQQEPSFGPLNDKKLSHADYFFRARIAPLLLSCLFFRFMCLQSHLKTVAKVWVWSTKCIPCDFSAPPNWHNHTYCIPCEHHHSKNWIFPHIVTDFLHFFEKMLPAFVGEHDLKIAFMQSHVEKTFSGLPIPQITPILVLFIAPEIYKIDSKKNFSQMLVLSKCLIFEAIHSV